MIKPKGARKPGRRSSSTMKPDEFAQGESRVTRRNKAVDINLSLADGADSSVETTSGSPVEKHMIPPAKPRVLPFSSSFLQPEQFIAELKVTTGADIRPDLAFLASHRLSEPSQTVIESNPDLECFYEPANSVPTLELCYEGKPAPAPAHLRTKTGIPTSKTLPVLAVVTETGDKNSDSESSPALQKSGSSGRSFNGLRDKLVRSLSRGRDDQEPERVNDKQSGRLHRMLHWGSSMEFLNKLGNKKNKNGKQGLESPESQEVSQDHRLDPEEEDDGSPKSSASVSTTYSEVSSKSQSYKHSGHKKNLKSEVVKSKLWLLRVHQKLQGRKDSEDEGDGIYEALRQGAMDHNNPTVTPVEPEEAEDSLGVLESKNSISKLVAKHKRNSTWDAGNSKQHDHIFSPKQPRLPTRDAHVLLAPPKRLGTKPSEETDKFAGSVGLFKDMALNKPTIETVNLGRGTSRLPPLPGSQDQTPPSPRHSAKSSSPIRVELPTPPMSPRNGTFPGFSPPLLPLPVRASATSSPNPNAAVAVSPGGRGMPRSPGMYAATSPGGGVTGSTQGLQEFLLEDSSFARSQANRSDSAIAVARNGDRAKEQEVVNPGAKAQAEVIQVVNPGRPLPREPRESSFLSFEQIVAGRGRLPPTDNTLMKFFFKCREIDRLNKFLALQKRRFLDSSFADSEKCFHMIMSQAGAGLSSMISTICTAWLLENTMASATSRVWHPIPVMNMCQKDMWNHRDAAWLFHVCGIDANAVLFRDEITPTNEAVISGRVKRAVIGQDILVTKTDEVASSCTIVSEKFRQEAPKFLQARYMMTLLLAGILVDTKNLSSGSSRDKQQATILLVGAGSLGRNGFYNHLMNIRDEDFVTTFIKEIYGESNALTGEKPAQLAQGLEQPEIKEKDEKSEKLVSVAASKVSTEVVSAPAILLSQKPSTKRSSKSETESKNKDDMKSRKQSPHAPPNSKISLALRRLRSRSHAL